MKSPDVMVNLASPRAAVRAAALAVAGVGLMRAEFLFYGMGRHPVEVIAGGEDTFHQVLTDGMREVADAFYPRPVRYRTLDFKSNEMHSLAGGETYEAIELNPALGLRGVSRYARDRQVFLSELEALRDVRRAGLDNLQLMIPFVREPEEVAFCREAMDAAGLDRDVELWVMIEVPAMVHRVGDIAADVDGVSIGTNDLTQLLLGVDRDNPDLAHLYNDAHPAVIHAIETVVAAAREHGVGSSICGDAPSRHGNLVKVLVEAGIGSMSVPPDAVEDLRGIVDEIRTAGRV